VKNKIIEEKVVFDIKSTIIFGQNQPLGGWGGVSVASYWVQTLFEKIKMVYLPRDDI